MSKISHQDKSYDFNEIRDQFDPTVVEQMADKYDTDQDFFNTYLVKHHEKFGEQFVVR